MIALYGDKPQCVLMSFAMVMDEDPQTLIKELGHDGLSVVAYEEPAPNCLRSFHPQEFVDLLQARGFACTMFDAEPKMMHGRTLVDHTKFLGPTRFQESLRLGQGVIFGILKETMPHAVAWDGKVVFDPRGYHWSFPNSEFKPLFFFLVQRIIK